jgi:hypothetical protein
VSKDDLARARHKIDRDERWASAILRYRWVIAVVYVAGAILDYSKFGVWSRAIMLLVLGFAAYLAIGANWCQQAVKRRIAERRAKLDDDERPAASGLALAIPGAVGVLVVLAPLGVAMVLGLDWRRATRVVSLFWLVEVAAAVVYLRKYPSEYSEVVEVPGDVDDFMTRAADVFREIGARDIVSDSTDRTVRATTTLPFGRLRANISMHVEMAVNSSFHVRIASREAYWNVKNGRLKHRLAVRRVAYLLKRNIAA